MTAIHRARRPILALAVALVLFAGVQFRNTVIRALDGGLGVSCMSDAKQLVVAAQLYAQDNDGTLPPCSSATEFQAALLTYAKNPRQYNCCATGVPFQANPRLSRLKMSKVQTPELVWLVRETVPHDDQTYAVAFADGNAKRLKALPRHSVE